MIKNKWVPYYRLQTNTRDKLWGEIADYSKDINLMKKINSLYREFSLINNKIDIMNNVRVANLEKSNIDKSRALEAEKSKQLEGAIGLGNGAIKIARECLEIIEAHIRRLD